MIEELSERPPVAEMANNLSLGSNAQHTYMNTKYLPTTIYCSVVKYAMSSSHKSGNSQLFVVTNGKLREKYRVREEALPKCVPSLSNSIAISKRKGPSQSAVFSNAGNSPNHTSKVHTAEFDPPFPVRPKKINKRKGRKKEKSAHFATKKTKPRVSSYHRRIYQKAKEEEKRRR